MLNFFRENKLLAALFGVSFLVVLLGGGMVIYANHQADQQAKAKSQLQSLNDIANEAQSQLMQTVSHPDVPITDVIPTDSVEKVAAMKDKNPIAGTDDWCELMMVKPSKEWTTEEQQTFAKNCI